MKAAPALFNLRARDDDSGLLHVIIETAKGSRTKFKYDEKLALFKLHKVLPRGMVFPYDFGFVPSTRGEDGDPIDVLVVMEDATFPGCLVTTRLLGAIQAEQTEKGVTIRNDRLIGVPQTPKIHPKERSLSDLAPGLLDQIENFFLSYNRSEGRKFQVVGRVGPTAAAKLLDQAVRTFRRSGRGGAKKRSGSGRRA